MENKKINYIVFDVNGKVRKSYISNLVATSANQKVFVFNDADITTESTAYRSYARIKRADSFNVGPITLLASEITVENTGYTQDELNKFLESINVDYTSCRILILEKQALAVSGPISITVVYDRVNELGRTIETQAKAEVSAYVYNAVEEIFTEEEYNSIKEEMLPRDLGDITLGSEISNNDVFLGKQDGNTKLFTPFRIREYVEKYNVINLGEVAGGEDDFADSIVKRGVYRYEYDDGPFGYAGLLINAVEDGGGRTQMMMERDYVKYRTKPEVGEFTEWKIFKFDDALNFITTNKNNITNLQNNKIDKSEKGVANGVATLDTSGKVPASQLPSFVDDVLEYNTLAQFPTIGEKSKIYVDKQHNKTYRWSGTSYVVIGNDLALGETSSTAYSGAKGKANRDDINAILENKATNFDVVNDTKYPTTKAVSERLLNLPIAELNNHTLREVFEDGKINNYYTVDATSKNVVATRHTAPQFNFNGTSNGSSFGFTIMTSMNSGDKYYIIYKYISGYTDSYLYRNGTVNLLDNLNNDGNFIVTGVTDIFYGVQTLGTNDNVTFEIYGYNMTSLGISSLTVERMNYWFNAYKALLINDSNAIFSMFAPRQQHEAWIKNIEREVENLKIERNFNPIDSIKIIAHNGSAGNMGSPQNTILGLFDAYRLGYRAIEIDLQNTSDNEIVCFHDSTLDATTNGSGTVLSKTLSTLKTYDIDVPNVGVSGIKIPTLREYLDSIKMLNDMELFVEIKSTMTNDGIEKMLDILEEYNLRQSLTISSLHLPHLLYAKGLTSESSKYRFVWIKSSAFTETEIDSFYDTFGYGNGLMVIHTALTQDFINYTHSKGLYAGMYGTDNYQSIMNGQRMGLDFASSDTCVQNNLNRGQIILKKVPNGTTNPNLTISEATINQSVIELTMSIRYIGTAPTISLGNYNFIVPHNENEWGAIRMKVIAKNTTFSITQSSGTFEFIRCNLIVTNI